MQTPQLIINVLSDLIKRTDAQSLRELLEAALEDFIQLLLISIRPGTGPTILESNELLLLLQKLTKEQNIENLNFFISEGAKKQVPGGIVEVAFVRFQSSPHNLEQSGRCMPHQKHHIHTFVTPSPERVCSSQSHYSPHCQFCANNHWCF